MVRPTHQRSKGHALLDSLARGGRATGAEPPDTARIFRVCLLDSLGMAHIESQSRSVCVLTCRYRSAANPTRERTREADKYWCKRECEHEHGYCPALPPRRPATPCGRSHQTAHPTVYMLHMHIPPARMQCCPRASGAASRVAPDTPSALQNNGSMGKRTFLPERERWKDRAKAHATDGGERVRGMQLPNEHLVRSPAFPRAALDCLLVAVGQQVSSQPGCNPVTYQTGPALSSGSGTTEGSARIALI